MAGEWINGRDFSWMQQTPPDRTFALGMELGMRARHQHLNEQLAMRELESKVKLQETHARLKEAEITAYEQMATGNAELATALSETAGQWTSPEAKSRFWGIAARHPQVMKSPQFKELVDNFQLADQAELRSRLEDTRISSRTDLKNLEHQNRMELWSTRMARTADMKLDDHALRIELEQLRHENTLERDQMKPSAQADARMDLVKSDEIGLRSELTSLQTAFVQGVLDWDEFQKKRDGVQAKYKSRARTPAQPTSAPTEAKRIRVKAPDGTIGHIPESQLDEAKRSGYTVAE